MQRRRRPKAEPKDIFGTGSQTKPAKKEEPKPRKTQSSAPEPVPGPPPAIGIKLEAGSIPDEAEQAPQEVFPEPISTEDEESVLESQILGGPKKKSIGLQPITDGKPTETQAQSISPKAQELIEESRHRASKSEEESDGGSDETEEENEKPVGVIPRPVTPVVVVTRKFRRRRRIFQAANRAKRLDRSRHMEYKYEVRGLMDEIGILDEHRSNILGSIWAKGERQTVSDAKEYLEGKLSEGIITEDQQSRLLAVIDDYTIRR